MVCIVLIAASTRIEASTRTPTQLGGHARLELSEFLKRRFGLGRIGQLGKFNVERGAQLAGIQIAVHEDSRLRLLPLFRLADESESQILSYFKMGNVFVAHDRDLIVGITQLVEEDNAIEIVSLAVVPERRGEGIATGLIEEAETVCRLRGVRRLIVCTGSWETENIIFYVKRGFRIFNVVPDFFTPEKGYDLAIRDQVQLEKAVTGA
ncbi:GNAT family N-acetyltransferase [Hyphomicrobium sp.]|uniref:GNAT family N-acetyltransferase n=1 Tax=Hyphomicrobium sp. TaxID=82 RepID=UPI0025C34EED|nr:GNAT family N-acetyltransferase [Hyphomicrobium sp.]